MIREWIFDRWFGDLHERRLQEAMRGASGATTDDGFRRITDPSRDLLPLTHDRQREVAVHLWTYNPIARRIVETIVEWVVGGGIQIQAEDERTRDYLQRFWNDPVNRMDLKAKHKVRELFLMGEQFWPSFTGEFDGIMRLGVLDPSRVREVVTDPHNAESVIGVVTRRDRGGKERRYRTLLRGDEQEILSRPALAEREKFDDGEIFNFAVNKLSTARRGVSEIFALSDWLDGYEQLLFSILRQEHSRTQFMWDVTLEGASDEEIQEKLENMGPPKPFSVRVHNEKETWNLVGPEFGSASNNAEHARLFRNHVLGGAGVPEHWYGGGGDVNRATAMAMGTPAEKSFTAKQQIAQYVFSDLLSVQVERGIRVGHLVDAPEVRSVDVEMPEVSTRDLSNAAQSLQSTAAALVVGRNDGLISDKVAARVLSSLISQFGVEADAEEMLERARASLADELAEEYGRPGRGGDA